MVTGCMKRPWAAFAVLPAMLAITLALACAPAAPSSAPAPAPAPAIDREELRSVVQEAVAESSSDAVTVHEVKQIVGQAVADALAEQSAAQGPITPADRQAPGTPDEVQSFELTDVAGRTVTIEGPVERIILGEARQIYIVAALQPGNPFQKIIGWHDDLRRFDGDTYVKYM